MVKCFFWLFSVLILLCIGGCTEENTVVTSLPPPNAQRPSIVVGGIVYSTTGSVLTIDADESEYLGRIESVVSITTMPTENGQANISTVGSPYMKYEDGLAVEVFGEWTLYEIRDDLLSTPAP